MLNEKRSLLVLLGNLLISLLLIYSNTLAFAEEFECLEEISRDQAQNALKKVESRYRKIDSITSVFSQESLLAGGGIKDSSKGHLSFQKPGKMLWQYDSPHKEIFVTDGHNFIHHDIDGNSATQANFKGAFTSELPVAFLLGLGSLREQFVLQRACRDARGIWFKLKPKDQGGTLDEFDLKVSSKDFSPKVARVREFGSSETTIVLLSPKFNVKLKKGLFDYKVPRGVDFVQGDTP